MLQASIVALKYIAWVNECLNAVYLVSVLYRDLVSPRIDSWNQKYETERIPGIKASREKKKTDDLEVGDSSHSPILPLALCGTF